jgi:hypothetical protein
MKRTVLLVLTLCTMLLTTTISAHAQVINACAGRIGGLLRIVNSPSQCTGFERAISWNEAGPVGPQGSQGPQGPAGPQGQPGITAGIKAQVWGEFAMNDIATGGTRPDCTVVYSNGAASIDGTAQGNGACSLKLTLPATQPQSWGTAFACFAAVRQDTFATGGTTCAAKPDFDATDLNKPLPTVQCRDGNGFAPTGFYFVDFVCFE